jgi:hypothetical protein
MQKVDLIESECEFIEAFSDSLLQKEKLGLTDSDMLDVL